MSFLPIYLSFIQGLLSPSTSQQKPNNINISIKDHYEKSKTLKIAHKNINYIITNKDHHHTSIELQIIQYYFSRQWYCLKERFCICQKYYRIISLASFASFNRRYENHHIWFTRRCKFVSWGAVYMSQFMCNNTQVVHIMVESAVHLLFSNGWAKL